MFGTFQMNREGEVGAFRDSKEKKRECTKDTRSEVTVRVKVAREFSSASPRHENALPSFLIGKLPSNSR